MYNNEQDFLFDDEQEYSIFWFYGLGGLVRN